MARGSWEQRDYSHILSGTGDGEDVDDMSPAACSQAFMDMLVQMKLEGAKMTAKSACILSYWAQKGGLAPPGDLLALEPGIDGGRYSSHFDKTLGFDQLLKKESWYTVKVPGHRRHDASRCVRDVSAQPIFTALASELSENPGIWDLLDQQKLDNNLPPSYLQHPLVAEHGHSRVLPIGLYLDGVQYQTRDSTTGFWAINLLTQQRHLICCLPKREACRCGCSGLCSNYPVLSFIEWCVWACAEGRVPLTRHDGSAWGPTDSLQAGMDLGFRAAVTIIKGDWAEFSTTLGFRSWQHYGHPCHRCFATGGPGGDLQSWSGLSVISDAHRAKTWEDWDNACSAVERDVTVNSQADLDMILGATWFDKRHQKGSRGRAMKHDLRAFGLKKNDRMATTETVQDYCAVDDVKTFPLVLRFWRVPEETMCRFRCPLFTKRSFLHPGLCCVDELHTMHLGVFEEYIIAVLWGCVDSDIWNARAVLAHIDSYRIDCGMRLRSMLMTWYHRQKAEHPDRPNHELSDFDIKTLGKADKPGLVGVKAAEAGTLMRFAAWVAGEHHAVLINGQALAAAGRGLVGYMDATRSCKLVMPPRKLQDLANGLITFLRSRESAGIAFKPKTHLCSHLPKDALFFGNPCLTGTWVDEGLNLKLRQVCASAHSAVWSQRVLATFAHASGPTKRAPAVSKKRARTA